MSYRDGKVIPGSHSPYTVWLHSSSPMMVVGIDYRNLNDLIQLYNTRYYKYVEFWPWLSNEAFFDDYDITGFDAIWNDHNENMNKVLPIK